MYGNPSLLLTSYVVIFLGQVGKIGLSSNTILDNPIIVPKGHTLPKIVSVASRYPDTAACKSALKLFYQNQLSITVKPKLPMA